MGNKLYGECLRMKKAGKPSASIREHHARRSQQLRDARAKWAFRFKRKSEIEVIT